jgi:hydroxypyruvate reductase
VIEDPRQFLLDLFRTGVAAASPERCLPARLPEPAPGRIGIIACGKAALPMAALASRHFGERTNGLVIYPRPPGVRPNMPPGFTGRAATHPLPGDGSVEAARAALAFAASLGPRDMLLVLLSGGGSALMALPAAGVSLADKQALTRRLLACGAAIEEINCVRRHLSRVKGGRLAAATRAHLLTLAISDVPGGDPATIASGPTVGDLTTLADARAILAHCAIDAPGSIRDALRDPSNETLRPGDLPPNRYEIVASGMTALNAAAARCRELGVEPLVLGDRLQGDAIELAAVHARQALTLAARGRRCCLLSGGETSVRLVPKPGRGGRNTTYALALAVALSEHPRIWALAADTDGVDGSGGHSGAVLTTETMPRARGHGLEAEEFLRKNDSATLFDRVGDLLTVGPTATNVNDFRAILVDP